MSLSFCKAHGPLCILLWPARGRTCPKELIIAHLPDSPLYGTALLEFLVSSWQNTFQLLEVLISLRLAKYFLHIRCLFETTSCCLALVNRCKPLIIHHLLVQFDEFDCNSVFWGIWVLRFLQVATSLPFIKVEQSTVERFMSRCLLNSLSITASLEDLVFLFLPLLVHLLRAHSNHAVFVTMHRKSILIELAKIELGDRVVRVWQDSDFWVDFVSEKIPAVFHHIARIFKAFKSQVTRLLHPQTFPNYLKLSDSGHFPRLYFARGVNWSTFLFNELV